MFYIACNWGYFTKGNKLTLLSANVVYLSIHIFNMAPSTKLFEIVSFRFTWGFNDCLKVLFGNKWEKYVRNFLMVNFSMTMQEYTDIQLQLCADNL